VHPDSRADSPARHSEDTFECTRGVLLAKAPQVQHVRDVFGCSLALVMGVNAYARGIPGLRTAVPDAEAITSLLEVEHGFTGILLRDGEVTRERLRDLLARKLRGELTERDRLLVYFAGHGLSLPSEHGPEGCLLLADADPGDPSTFLAMSELRKLVSALPCRHVLIVLDCCFAGTFRWAGDRIDRHAGGPAYRETLDRFVKHRAWQVLVSAGHDQTALDTIATPGAPEAIPAEVIDALGRSRIEREQHSPFAAALLRALRGAADFTKDGLIVASEIELYVRDAVENATRVHQTPQLYKLEQHDRGEFVFQVPGTTLDLAPAPALSIDVCPYQGLRPYSASDRDRFFGRARAIEALVKRVTAHPLTVVLGPSGAGKSSLVAAGVIPALRAAGDWRVIEARPDATPDETLRDLIAVEPDHGVDPGRTLLERVTSWLSVHVADRLCLVIDQAEGLEMLALAEARGRLLGDLAQALDAHRERVRVVLMLRSEFEPVLRASALSPFWDDAVFVVPALAHHELREIVERPARALELSFEPPSLVDTLIDEVLQAPAGLPLLSFALRELYVRCVQRNRDRLLTGDDYARMGRLSGALTQRASALLNDLVVVDAAYSETARRVFLRMVAGRGGEWVRRRAHREEFVYADEAETRRAATLLTAFREARLVVLDGDEWEPAHDWLVRGWPKFSLWRAQFGARALELQFDLAEAAHRWHSERRTAALWSDDARLPDARIAWRAPESWLNARERAFIAASIGRRRLRLGAALATLALAVLAGVAVWDLYFRTHVAYYHSYVRRWGEPEGLDAVTEREAGERASSIKLVRRGHFGHVLYMESVSNGAEFARENIIGARYHPELGVGQKSEGERVPARWDFAYETDTGAVSAEIAKDRANRIVYRLQYRGGSGERTKAEFLDQHGDDAPVPRGDAERVEFVRSTQGYDKEKHYTLRHGEPAQNQDGISVEVFTYDERGHPVLMKYLDAAGRPARSKNGVAGYRLTVDAHGNVTERTALDEAGKPTRSKDGIMGFRSTFDAHGNETGSAMIDEAGKPTRRKDGFAGYRSAFDARGNRTEVVVLDEAGKPTRGQLDFAGYRSTFDGRGNETERIFLDEAGKPTRGQLGFAGYRSTFDARGNETERIGFDEAGKPTRSKAGIAGYRSTFDARDNETERIYLDEAGRPTRSNEGIAGYRSTFDARGNEAERVFLDEAGQPTRNKGGIAGYRSTFDARGNEVQRMVIDELGKTMRINDGVAGYRSTFDARGNETERTYSDEDGRPTRSRDGFAGYRSTLDARGNETERIFLDEAGRPTRRKDGIAGYRTTLDAYDNEIERGFIDEAGRPTHGRDGYAGYRSRFDARGNEIERSVFDEAGRPVRGKDGFAGYRSRFDAHGNETERSAFDEAGRPVRGKIGYASYRSRFDVRGDEIERAFFDEAGQPTRDNEGYAGYRSRFDAVGHEIERAFLDEAASLVHARYGYAGYRSRFDAAGHEIERAFFDIAENPTRDNNGIAGVRVTFDARGNEVQRMAIDELGKTMRSNDGTAGFRSTFDARGHEIERMLLDEAGNPTRGTGGVAGYRSTFDARGNEIERMVVDEAGKPTRNEDGIAGFQSTFNVYGNEIERVYVDELGRPSAMRNGYAVIRVSYDDGGKLIDAAAFNRAGERLEAVPGLE
jgi:hypothetical protein